MTCDSVGLMFDGIVMLFDMLAVIVSACFAVKYKKPYYLLLPILSKTFGISAIFVKLSCLN